MSGSKCLGLDQTSLLSMGSGDRLVRGLTSSNGVMDTVVGTVMGQQDGACGGSAGHSQEGEADKGLKENLSEKHLRFSGLTAGVTLEVESR